MLFEPRIGKLIRKLNPYTNGGMDTMLCGLDAPTDPVILNLLNALGNDLVQLGNALIAYAAAPNAGTLNQVNIAENQIDLSVPMSDFNLRIDNDYRQDYMTWVFRTQPYKVKRALRVTYRYQLPPPVAGNPPTGIYATEHVLIGYAGGNG